MKTMPLPIPELTDADKARFWYYVAKHKDCWPWIGATSSGYGRFKVGKKLYQATRIMLSLHGKQSDLLVCHTCHNRECVKPDHLYFGTYKENANDKLKDGTLQHGSQNGMSKLREVDIPVIRKLSDYIKVPEIARLYGVDRTTIGKVIQGRSWRQILFMLLMLLPITSYAEGGMWGAVLNNPTYSLYKEPKKIVAYYPEYTEKQKIDAWKVWNQIDFWYGRYYGRHFWRLR